MLLTAIRFTYLYLAILQTVVIGYEESSQLDCQAQLPPPADEGPR